MEPRRTYRYPFPMARSQASHVLFSDVAGLKSAGVKSSILPQPLSAAYIQGKTQSTVAFPINQREQWYPAAGQLLWPGYVVREDSAGKSPNKPMGHEFRWRKPGLGCAKRLGFVEVTRALGQTPLTNHVGWERDVRLTTHTQNYVWKHKAFSSDLLSLTGLVDSSTLALERSHSFTSTKEIFSLFSFLTRNWTQDFSLTKKLFVPLSCIPSLSQMILKDFWYKYLACWV